MTSRNVRRLSCEWSLFLSSVNDGILESANGSRDHSPKLTIYTLSYYVCMLKYDKSTSSWYIHYLKLFWILSCLFEITI